MKLSQCAAFVAVTDLGSFTAAAQALGVTQSAVSHAIAGLERELGARLLHRGRGGAELTGTGRRVLRHARGVLRHAGQMRDEVDIGAEGTIRIGTSQSFAVHVLPRLLTDLHTRFPELDVQLQEGTDTQVTHWLRRSEVDVGIVTLPKPDLPLVPLTQDDMHLVAPAGHPAVTSGPVTLRRLAREPLILPLGGVEPILCAALRVDGLEPRVVHRVRDVTALLALVTAGHGLTVLPELALPRPLNGLSATPFTPSLRRRLAIGTRTPGVRETPVVAAFITAARALVSA
jgi:DNA-binding transcriptional LysR family regulator